MARDVSRTRLDGQYFLEIIDHIVAELDSPAARSKIIRVILLLRFFKATTAFLRGQEKLISLDPPRR
jgi:hypothetical protein